jgi:hypothetical protein
MIIKDSPLVSTSHLKTDVEFIRNVTDSISKTGVSSLMSGHFIMFWLDPTVKQYVSYDAKDPAACYTAVTKGHPNFEFAGMYPVPNANVAIEHKKSLKQANIIITEVDKMLNTLRLTREKTT